WTRSLLLALGRCQAFTDSANGDRLLILDADGRISHDAPHRVLRQIRARDVRQKAMVLEARGHEDAGDPGRPLGAQSEIGIALAVETEGKGFDTSSVPNQERRCVTP